MSQLGIQNKLKQAKAIERQLPIQNKDIKNFVEYLHAAASDRSNFVPCCCGRSQLQVTPAFHRAFKLLTRPQKVDYYYKTMTVLKSCFEGQYDRSVPEEENIKNSSLFFFNDDEGHWETRRIEINNNKKSFKFTNGGGEINLQFYVLRNSKKKDRKSIALESTESLQHPQTMRLSNNKQTFQQMKQMIQKLIFGAQKQMFLKTLQSSGLLPPQKQSPEKAQLKLMKVSQKKSNQPLSAYQNNRHEQSVVHVDIPTNRTTLSLNRNSLPEQLIDMTGLQYEKMKIKLMNSMTNFANLTEQSKNVYFDLKENRVRKVFQIKEDDYKIPLEWFSDNLMSCSSFKRWKKTLKTVKTIKALQRQPNHMMFFEKHEFKQKISNNYIYKREKYEPSSDTLYFFDVAAQDPNKKLTTKTKIQYVIWKFQRNKNFLIISVEAKIQHDSLKVGNLSISLTQQYIGQIDKLMTNSNSNTTLLGDSNFNINTILFEEQYVSQIEELKGFSLDDADFHSILCSSDGQEDDYVPSYGVTLGQDMKKSINILRVTSKQPSYSEIPLPRLNSGASLTGPNSNNLLKWHHPTQPFPKPSSPSILKPKQPGNNPFWEDQFKFNDKGDMVSINEAKLAAQKGVLSQLVKSVGRNLFSGKSILSISLPVTIFSKQSNLSLLCKAYRYAPILLEKAVAQQDPVQRFKYIVAFGLSFTVAYLQMDKPFNPILGQTFNNLINGCPVYGQQVSHHPPISSVYMKGRGYHAYGNYQAKVNLSLNSAKGSNDGITYVSFDQKNPNHRICKFTVPPGEVSGVMWGERIIRATDKTQYLDVDNRLYLELTFGKHKGTSQFCKFFNGVEGKLYRLPPDIDITQFPKIKVTKNAEYIGLFSGKWSELICYQDEVIFNSWKEYPPACEEYPCPLQSDCFKRKDLQLRIEEKMEQAQTAKEELENIQRNDRKLRAKYHGDAH